MKQFTFLQEGTNKILSKVQKSFWSCTHVNSCQNYALYINLHILFNIRYKKSKYPRIKKIHQMIQKITRIDEKDKILVSCYHMIYYIQDLYYISIYIFY